MQCKWRNDEAAEQVIASLGLSYTRATISLSDIDKAASLKNRARYGVSVDKQVVMTYAGAMKDGDVFPEIVVRKVPKKGYVTAGGNHRTEACAEVGSKQAQALVVECDDLQFDALCKMLNTVVGVAPTYETRVLQAVEMCGTHNIKATQAARLLRVDAVAVDRALAVNHIKKLGLQHGIGMPKSSDQTLYQFTTLRDNEPVLLNVLRAVEGRPLVLRDATELRKVIQAKKSEATKLEAIGEWTRNCTIAKATRSVSSPVKRGLLTATAMLENKIGSAKKLTQLQMDKDEAAQMAKRLTGMLSSLKRLLAAG